MLMIKTTIKVNGMMCPMCEAHVNDAVRNNLVVKKTASSHKNSECVILSDTPLDEAKLREVIEKEGYTTGDIITAEEEKKSIFSIFKK